MNNQWITPPWKWAGLDVIQSHSLHRTCTHLVQERFTSLQLSWTSVSSIRRANAWKWSACTTIKKRNYFTYNIMILCICTIIKPRCYANSHYGAEHVLVNTVVLVIFATRVIKSKEIKIRAFLPFCGQTTMLSWSTCAVYAVMQIAHKSSLRQLHALLQWPELVSAISCKNPFCLNKPGFFPNSSWKCWDASLYSPFRNSRSAIIYKHGSENMKHFSTLTLHLHKFVMLLQLSLIPRPCIHRLQYKICAEGLGLFITWCVPPSHSIFTCYYN